VESEVAGSVPWCVCYKQPGWGWAGPRDEDEDGGDESKQSALADARSPDEVWSVLRLDACYLE